MADRNHIPFELIVNDILLRLPVADLLRCRAVSKRWCYLIDSHRFVSLHLTRSALSRSNRTLFLRHKSSLRTLHLDSLSLAGSHSLSPEEINYPLMCYSDDIKLLGSCNGLVCLSNAADDVIIWNPSLRKHRFLPYFAIEGGKSSGTSLLSVCVYGFGFVPSADDYKLLRVVEYIRQPIESDVCLYSMKSNSWKRIQELPYSLIYPRKMGVFVDRALHWIMTPELVPDSPNFIIGFDLETEDYVTIPQPDALDKSLEIDLSALEGCLCMIANNTSSSAIDVWIMNEYRVKESWVNLFSILQSDVPRPKGFMWPLAYSQDGQRILLQHDRKRLFWYDVKHGVIERIQIRGMPSSFQAEVCLRSLVQVDYRENHKEKEKRREYKESRNKRDDFLSVGFKLVL